MALTMFKVYWLNANDRHPPKRSDQREGRDKYVECWLHSINYQQLIDSKLFKFRNVFNSSFLDTDNVIMVNLKMGIDKWELLELQGNDLWLRISPNYTAMNKYVRVPSQEQFQNRLFKI
jgi:hypothetical protein